ncbi:ADP-ribosylglycohydrolase family protein [Anaerocolumna sp. MB42-C2]|uniref:ADP-ribosylglycohydrolase family protein n=1 Tax=Anaerocolumna sp. MB42-C2 TaxID=3070997 RepID=UPI0027E07E8F|nr:ADP-ribosylglycohydrolase family protein [Anaerocolumna sp. MB42-C2]WMJ89927.1 ADP-ribosylglycohydrolase family protein [Anaerocolumna sp. MB42-C2]
MDMIYDRILGGMIGIALGDAFGMPSEMWSRKRIKDYFGEIHSFKPGPDENAISKGLKAGEVTDDTMNTIFVTEMLYENRGKADPYLYIKKLKHWSKTSDKSIAVIGPSTSKAIKLLEEGTPIEETGKTGITNGAAMKILPIGFVYSVKNMEEMVKEVYKLCLPTHNTSAAISGASAIAAAGSYMVSGGSSMEKLLETACEAAEIGIKYGYDVASASIRKRILMGKRIVDSMEREKQSSDKILDEIYDVIGTGLPITESVPAALTLVYLAKGDPIKCARYCANIGGDTDTLGAMGCGICGAGFGGQNFPAELVETLEQTNHINFSMSAEWLTELRKTMKTR